MTRGQTRWAVFFVGLLAGAALVFFHFREGRPAKVPRQGADDARREGPAPVRKPGAPGEIPCPAPAAPAITVTGRVVRGDPASPAAGVTVRSWTGPEAVEGVRRAPSLESKSGPDGRFEIGGVPERVPVRFEIDEPASALLAYRIEELEPDAAGRLDVGEFRLEPPLTLTVRVVGSEDQPVDGGRILPS